jgi:hypothetical protein
MLRRGVFTVYMAETEAGSGVGKREVSTCDMEGGCEG